ncbi:MAG TPA: F0F1 ATP synthase subunit B [Candidatus Paceibacterota bacterium]
MEQLLTVFGINWKLLLAQGFNFALLLVLLTYFLYKPVLKIIDERREKIAEGVKTAEAAARKLEEAKKKSDSIIGSASREAEGLVAVARVRANEQGVEIIRSAENRADSILDDAKARAEEEKRQALLESEREITRAAMLAAEKILRTKSQ